MLMACHCQRRLNYNFGQFLAHFLNQMYLLLLFGTPKQDNINDLLEDIVAEAN